MKKALTALSVAALAFLSFGATAIAAGEVTPDDGSLLDLARPVFDAVMHGQWWLGAALAVVLLTAAAKKYLPDAYGGKYVRSELGAMATAFLLSFGGAIATTMAAPGAAMTMAVAMAALKIGAAAVGGWMILHKVMQVVVATKFWNDRVPAPVKALVSFVLGLVGSSAISKAEKAGQEAVDASPPQGPAQVNGEIGQI